MTPTDRCSYDPSFEVHEFGKLSALREIVMARDDSYEYYYMGQTVLSYIRILLTGKQAIIFILAPR